MDQESNQSRSSILHIRGVGSFNKAATLQYRILSIGFDTLCILAVAIVGLELIKIPPIPCFATLALIISVPFLYVFLQKRFFGTTIGERIWHLKKQGAVGSAMSTDGTVVLRQRDHLEFFEKLNSIFLTAITCAIAILAVRFEIVKNPLWLHAPSWNIEASIPQASDQWQIMPIFYHLGTLPIYFQNKPILYSLTYKYGPPKKFIGQMVLTLKDPSTQLIIEGPKTPDNIGTREEIKSCFLQNSASFSCLNERYRILKRHLEELENDHFTGPFSNNFWHISWFQVTNPSLTEEDQAQGVYLMASGRKIEGDQWIQDRFILMNANGTQQTIILNREPNSVGSQAFELATQTVSSLRGFRSLDAGKAWVNRELESVNLNLVGTNPDLPSSAVRLAELAKIQSLLIAKISVEPGSFDSYYHLAGTSLILLNLHALQQKAPGSIPDQTITSYETNARENILASYLFARDVLPTDPRNTQIEKMVVEAKGEPKGESKGVEYQLPSVQSLTGPNLQSN